MHLSQLQSSQNHLQGLSFQKNLWFWKGWSILIWNKFKKTQ